MDRENPRRYFVLYSTYLEPVSDLTNEEAGELFKALLTYANGLQLPPMKDNVRLAFGLIKAQIDSSRKNYSDKCDTLRANALKGGRPKKGRTPEEQEPDSTQDNMTDEQEDVDIAARTPDAEEITDTAPRQEKDRSARKPAEKKSYAEFVSMTEAEYSKLTEKFGKPAADRMIEILDNYKGSSTKNAKRYTSDYRAILSWVVGKYEEEAGKARPPAQQQQKADAPGDWERFFQEGYRR